MIKIELKVGSAKNHIAIALNSLSSKYDFDLEITYPKTDIEAEATVYKNNKKVMIIFGTRIVSELESILERNWN